MQVSEVLAIKGKVLYTIGPSQFLAAGVAVMAEQDMGSLVVMEHGKMVGMLTFREVMKAVNKHGAGWGGVTISDVMLREPLTASANMELDGLRRLMIDHHQRYLPVMEDTTLLGVVSFHDVAKAVLEEQSFENKMLKNYIRDWPEVEEDNT